MRTGATPSAAVVAVLAAALAAGPAAGQTISGELWAGAAVGSYTEADAGLDMLPEAAFGALLEAALTEDMAAYVGFTRVSFGCEEGWCRDQDVSMTSQGFVVGGRWSPRWLWVRAGLTLRGLDIDAAGAQPDFDPGVGVELGGGAAVHLGRGVELRPGISYMRHPASSEFSDGHVALLAFQVGIAAELARF